MVTKGNANSSALLELKAGDHNSAKRRRTACTISKLHQSSDTGHLHFFILHEYLVLHGMMVTIGNGSPQKYQRRSVVDTLTFKRHHSFYGAACVF